MFAFVEIVLILMFLFLAFAVGLTIWDSVTFAAWTPVAVILGATGLWWWALAWTLVCIVVAVKVEMP
jgi:hypothetical protein